VRKSLLVLGMVLDDAGIEPNPARAKTIILPREQKTEINPRPPSTSRPFIRCCRPAAAAARPRRDGDATGRARGIELGRRRRGAPALARIGEHVGQRDLRTTANTYSHVLIDEQELDYMALLEH